MKTRLVFLALTLLVAACNGPLSDADMEAIFGNERTYIPKPDVFYQCKDDIDCVAHDPSLRYVCDGQIMDILRPIDKSKYKKCSVMTAEHYYKTYGVPS